MAIGLAPPAKDMLEPMEDFASFSGPARPDSAPVDREHPPERHTLPGVPHGSFQVDNYFAMLNTGHRL